VDGLFEGSSGVVVVMRLDVADGQVLIEWSEEWMLVCVDGLDDQQTLIQVHQPLHWLAHYQVVPPHLAVKPTHAYVVLAQLPHQLQPLLPVTHHSALAGRTLVVHAIQGEVPNCQPLVQLQPELQRIALPNPLLLRVRDQVLCKAHQFGKLPILPIHLKYAGLN